MFHHKSVLLQETIEGLHIKEDGIEHALKHFHII